MESLKKVEVASKAGSVFKFYVREGSSDEKTLAEVVTKNSYARRAFVLNSASWLDLGANIGAFTVLVASMGSKVRAYEPDPESFEVLCRNVELNGLSKQVELHNLAVVADERKKVAFHINSAKKNYWRNSTIKEWRGGHSIEVSAVHYSKVIGKQDDCKMDIEGAEMPILESLQTFPWRMVFEWSFDIDRSIPRFVAVMKKLRAHYADVTYAKFDEQQPEWKGEWFPPCRSVWCQ